MRTLPPNEPARRDVAAVPRRGLQDAGEKVAFSHVPSEGGGVRLGEGCCDCCDLSEREKGFLRVFVELELKLSLSFLQWCAGWRGKQAAY